MASSTAARLRTGVDKFEDRRRELADATLLTLADLGYARTSLRTIAEQTNFSHGLLHYYFADKTELITYCVRRYKTACVQRYEGLVAESSTPDELAEACGNGLAATLADAPLMHRLWYDLRSQSLFEVAFRNDVAEIDDLLQDMIWRLVRAYATSPAVNPPARPPPPTPCSTGFSTKHCSATLLAPRQRSTTSGRAAANCCPGYSSDGGGTSAAQAAL